VEQRKKLNAEIYAKRRSRPRLPRSAAPCSAEMVLDNFTRMMDNVFDEPLMMEGNAKSHYDVLGVSDGATQPEIQAGFDSLVAVECTRDDGRKSTAMEMLSQAYTVLSDPLARQAYDAARMGMAPPKPSFSRERLEADIASRLERRRRQMHEIGRDRRRRLQEGLAKGIAAKATMVGSYKVKASKLTKTPKSMSDLADEEKSRARLQWAKIHEIREKAGARSHLCDSTASSRALASCLDSGEASPAAHLDEGPATRRIKVITAEKKARLAAETRAQWKRIEEIKARGAARERRLH